MSFNIYSKNLRTAPTRVHHRAPHKFRPWIRCIPTPRSQNYGAHHLDIVIGYPEHLDHVIDASWDLNAKKHGAYYLGSVIGHPKYLAYTFDVFQHLEAKNYGVHHLDIVIGYPEYVGHVLDSPSDLNAKNYGRTTWTPSSATPKS